MMVNDIEIANIDGKIICTDNWLISKSCLFLIFPYYNAFNPYGSHSLYTKPPMYLLDYDCFTYDWYDMVTSDMIRKKANVRYIGELNDGRSIYLDNNYKREVIIDGKFTKELKKACKSYLVDRMLE